MRDDGQQYVHRMARSGNECLELPYASMLKIAIAEHDNAGKPLQVIEVEDERKYGSD